MINKTVVVTGVTGQDGSLLAELLLRKGFKVYGLVRRDSSNSLKNVKHLENEIEIVTGDLGDATSLQRLQNLARPSLFFNAAAQSDVKPSFDQPIYTAQTTGLGVLNCLEAIRLSGIHTRFLQMSSSEMFGGLPGTITEDTVFKPKSPYSVAKVFGYYTTIQYRESYNMFACNSICFNHEEPGKRGPNFVTRKICKGIKDILSGKIKKLKLGNLEAKRDWGLASEYCEGMYDLITSKTPEDVIFCTEEMHSVREFCQTAFSIVNLDYKDYIEIDPQLYRPSEVNELIGSAKKASFLLGWKAKTKFNELVEKMLTWELQND